VDRLFLSDFNKT